MTDMASTNTRSRKEVETSQVMLFSEKANQFVSVQFRPREVE